MFTLNTVDRHVVCYEKEQNFPVESVGHELSYSQFSRGGCCDPLTACDYKSPIVVCYGVDCRNGTINHEVSATVQAKGGGV